jgi:N-acetylglucosamine kinase-like BadF-type ATPase
MMCAGKSKPDDGLFLAADAGATHTRALVATRSGQILGRGTAGPSNSYAVGKVLASANLRRALLSALRSAQVRASDIAVATIGSASVGHDGTGAEPIQRELRSIFPKSRLVVVADARIALEGALAGGPGVVIVCGTGSIILAKAAKGKRIRIGGWGPLIGDEGSAQWVGREAVRRASYAADGTGRDTLLLKLVRRHFGLRSFAQIIDVIYSRPMTSGEWGKLAPLASRAAFAGDAVARDIFRLGAHAVALQAASAVRRLHLRSALVSFQGAMFRTGPLMLNPLRAALRKEAPGAKLKAPILSPLGGAFLMAIESCQIPVTPQTLAHYRKVFRA